MKEKILIVDDEEDIISFLKDSLQEDDYEVFVAYSGIEAVEKAKLNPDLILLDVMMPGKNGYEVCREIRDIVNCPIIFLTAKSEEEDLITGLGVGGDDYISKPFSLRQLKARISAHLRRDQRSFNNENRVNLYFENLNIDLKGRTIFCMGEVIPLTKKEFGVIELLAVNCGQVFSKEQIYEKIWGYDAEGDSATVAEHIKKIRYKLKKYDKDREYISTVWGVGYKWEK
ncbi:chemotaxis protein CheY [Clostridium carboxidivorans P7]|uniref:Stage 0 sporulation protein A homolog n=1 Tax=Clostridium carboxidivorans P7 TaxID=536227 RepID=C6PUE7_9CLOT|nr:response regulator transcription factor [Clostridium carboxidivorans]AKN30553.1 chemotaxis protein CheY [Clostridium carboxidivorans P7]EET87145.1 two component transcriptional regulator, winged helix family [Clostridium carboxidivorans P7]EFG86299.1 putative subtilin biosynthesis regulatory protein SpaR [Clostridium carboxidivorans P7]